MRGILYFAFFFFFFLHFQFTFQQLQRLSSPADFAALLDLRSSLGLRSKDWPIKGGPCSVWNGISCQNGRVIGINISGFRRTRIGKQNPQFSVDSLANLTLLQSFNASNFFLPGVIPDWFGQRLSSLQVLDLRSCSVIGSIPSSLGNLNNLTRLHLSNNNLTGSVPFTLSQLIRLSILDLSHNLLTGSISLSFASLGNLTLLDLSSNYFAGSFAPATTGSLAKLQYLNLSRNSFSSFIPSWIGDLDSLIGLDLSFNSFSGSLPRDFRGLKSLQRMEVGSNLVGGILPENLFSSLTQLQFLVLSNNKFIGSVPEELWSMPGLLLFDISGNNFSGIAPNSSSNSSDLAGLLNISNNAFYGDLSPVFRRFGTVDVSSNYFEGKVPDYLLSNASLGTNCLQNVSKQRTRAECSSYYTSRGLTFDNFGLLDSTQPAKPGTSKSTRLAVILGSSIGGLVLIILLVLVVLILLCRRRRGGAANDRREAGVRPVSQGQSEQPDAVSINFASLGDAFTHTKLLEATSGFSDSNLIKHGHSGDLFRGVLENGNLVIIKRVDLKSMKKEAYLSELEFLGRISHPRLIPLVGHCLETENDKFLVYKYMPNGDLSSSLFRKITIEDGKMKSLDWITRLKIALGAAEGLSFLHHECTPPLVHRDVQASSILLDDKFDVQLGSLSEVCAQEGDAHQNRITRLLRLPQSSEQGSLGLQTTSCSYDVYCFGKVLLELVTGKLGISGCNESQLKEQLEQIIPYINISDKELVTKIVDPSLIVDEDLLEEVWAMAVVAKSCLNPKPSRRPLMKYIVKALENPLKVVREENSNSARLRTTTSSGSLWSAAIFSSWRHSLSDRTLGPGASTRRAGWSSFKQSGTSGSQGSGPNGRSENSSSRRRQSKEIVPESADVVDVGREC